MKKNIIFSLLFFITLMGFENKDVETLKMAEPEKVLEFYQIMKDVHDLLILHGVTYWADSGTLIGAVRHSGFIPWDWDLDICVAFEDEQKLKSLKPLFQKLGYSFFRQYSSYKIRGKNGMLDILIMKKVDDGRFIFSERSHRYRWGKRDGGAIYYTTEELFPLKEYNFGESVVMGPQNPIPYLTAMYGDEWQDFARYKSYLDEQYSSVRVKLTPELRKAAVPTGPLLDRVKESIIVSE